MDPRQLHDKLKELTQVCCPATSQFPNGYYWCLTQVEYAQDLVFKDQATMDQLFEELARQALLTIKVQDVARFLGKRVPLGQDTQVNSHLGRRYAGLRLKHSFGPASVKLYNKPGGILRLEMTTYDVSFFKHYRQVVHQDGTQEQCLATMKKSLYSLRDLAQLMQAGVKRYSQWLASLREHTAAQQDVQRLGRPAHDQQGRSYRGFNPFLNEDEQVLQTLLRGEHALAGLTARRLRSVLEGWSRGQISRLLKRFRLHGLLRKIGHTYTYHLTPLARRVVTAVLDIKNNMMVPELAAAAVKN
jgi:heme oxygenase